MFSQQNSSLNVPASGVGSGTGVKDKIFQFVSNWNIESSQTHTTHQLVGVYLACGIAAAKWEQVYQDVGAPIPFSLFIHKGRVSGNNPEKFARRQDSALIYREMFTGAVIGAEARKTDVWKDFEEAVAGVKFEPGANCDCACLVLFHLAAGGTPKINTAISDPSMAWIVRTTYSRELLSNRLVGLRDKWKRTNPASSFAQFIKGCSYTCISDYEWKDFTPITAATSTAGTGSNNQQHSAVKSSIISYETCKDSIFPFVVQEPPSEWQVVSERMFADEPIYRDYKKQQGWPSFYGSRDTVKSFYREPPASYASIQAPDMVKLSQQLADHARPSILMDTAQGLAFAKAIRRCISESTCQCWTTRDVLQRLFIVHHPRWKEFFDYAYGPDLVTNTEMSAYLKQYPKLANEMIDKLF